MQAPELPEPDAYAKAHSAQLIDVVKEHIEASGGVISFADYMHKVLYEPGLGYYMAGAAKFGAEGDFITAPEVSPLFGASMAVQIAEILDAMPTGGCVLELGAGSGQLANSILNNLECNADFQYFILEPSAELQQRQRQMLNSSLSERLFSCVQWLDALPTNFTGVIVANEVMDALAVERFSIGQDGLQQVCVTGDLQETVRPASKDLNKAVAALEHDIGESLPLGYTSEFCAFLPLWIEALAASLNSGVLILVDYGYPRREYYSDERLDGTLSCYYRHRAHGNPYYLPGLQDITAHVDFTAVVEAGVASGLELLGYAAQSAFLLDNELLSLAEARGAICESEKDHMSLMKQVKTLTLPGEMGERFQVMALGKGYELPLRGFRTQDLSYRL